MFTIIANAVTIKNDDWYLAQQVFDFAPSKGKLKHSKTSKDIFSDRTIREKNQ